MTGSADTIFALSSGAGKAGVAVIRISGAASRTVVEAMTGSVPEARRAALRAIRGLDGGIIDRGLVLWLPGPGSFSGEDMAEFHIHGGSAVKQSVVETLGNLDGMRPAEAGEFTRRAFENGRLDLTEV
jgi:tRNA modification GTPase